MSFLSKNRYLFLLFVLFTTALAGCYKKDLEEFRKVDGLTYEPEIALPFLEKKVTLNDTIPTVPAYTSVTMTDTASIELPASKDKDTLESIIEKIDFKLRLENTFPFSGSVQIYFADSNNVYIDSLLDNSQRVVAPGAPVLIKDLVISVDKQRYIDLTQKSKKMYFYYNLTTSDISGLNDSYLLINMGMKAKLSIKLTK